MYRSASIIQHPKEHKISMTPLAHKKDYKDFNDVQKNTTVVPKSSPLIEDEQTITP
jgi:hypothetical protein